jgi:predicted ATP-binding protein involved in virulence
MLRVTDIHIENINGIRSMDITLNSGVNIICGPNGLGKSTIVECIIAALSSHQSIRLTRNSEAINGSCQITFSENNNPTPFRFNTDRFSDKGAGQGNNHH